MNETGGDGKERDRVRPLRCSKTEGGREGETGKGAKRWERHRKNKERESEE